MNRLGMGLLTLAALLLSAASFTACGSTIETNSTNAALAADQMSSARVAYDMDKRSLGTIQSTEGETSENEGENTDSENSEAEAERESAQPVRPLSSLRFLKGLTDKGNASNADALRLAYMLAMRTKGDNRAARKGMTAEGYLQALVDEGIIDGFDGELDANLEHQAGAWLFAHAIQLKGGVWWSLTGNMRYGHREMIDRGFFPSINPRQFMSGAEIKSVYRDCYNWVEEQKLTATEAAAGDSGSDETASADESSEETSTETGNEEGSTEEGGNESE